MNVEEARAWFAEDLRVAAGVISPAVINAFARVPRELFLGPPPWRVGTRVSGVGIEQFAYQTFDGDPCVLYHDVVVALDEEKDINNGQPSLWARMFDELGLGSGGRILHLGCGGGYYTAVLAEIAGSTASLAAMEIDTKLAARAREALADRPNVSVVCADGAEAFSERYNAIVVSAGATHPLDSWLVSLMPGGRLLFPLTMDGPGPGKGSGAMLLVSRTERNSYAARFLGPVGFIHFRGGRDAKANERLLDAFRKRFRDVANVRSLRRDEHTQDDTCWLHGPNFCLSCREPA